MVQPVEWLGDRVRLLDQTRLPGRQEFIEARDVATVADAINRLCVRGAPAIGVAGAYGAALGAVAITSDDRAGFLRQLHELVSHLAATRPTAVNLAWALHRVERAAQAGGDVADMKRLAVEEAERIQAEEAQATSLLAAHGAALVPDAASILTHCNAGGLATCGCGTALGVIRAAKAQGKDVKVFATETRPLFQGARLTAWELSQDGIPVTLIIDSAAGRFMSSGAIDMVVVGADRVAGNGDVANKIGTYPLAVVARENGVPFYVAAPLSTVDLALESGELIPIEERSAREVTHVNGVRIAAEGVSVANPAFDVTPARYVTAILTECGVVRPPYGAELRKASLSDRRGG